MDETEVYNIILPTSPKEIIRLFMFVFTIVISLSYNYHPKFIQNYLLRTKCIFDCRLQ